MTVIRPNSVSGINSITAQADEIKVFKSNGTQGGLIIGGANLNATSGISTILALNVTGNVSIAGTLTYQDVTNIDSVGLITARSGIDCNGTLEVSSTSNFDGAVQIADTILHLGDADTKIRFPAADTISFETAGSERVRIGSNGYVNIGTGSAEQQLTVQNSAQHSLIRVIGNASSDTGVDFGDPADSDIGRIRYSNNGDYMTFRVNNINSVRFDSSGSVQIGGGDTPSQTGDGRLIVYSTDRLHPAIKCAGMSNNYANGWTLLGDNYQADESQINLGVSYSSSSLVLSRGVKVSGSADNTYLSSQDSYAMRPSALVMGSSGELRYHTTETNATTATDSAVSLTEVFQIDRVGNIYQRITNRFMYFGASNVLRIGTNGSDPMIDAVSGDLQIKDAGNNICIVRSDGFEMYQGIYPTADNSKDLGKSGNRWANIYSADLQLSNVGTGGNEVDGTEGSWTLQEAEDTVYMINRISGKRYKIKMEEV